MEIDELEELDKGLEKALYQKITNELNEQEKIIQYYINYFEEFNIKRENITIRRK